MVVHSYILGFHNFFFWVFIISKLIFGHLRGLVQLILHFGGSRFTVWPRLLLVLCSILVNYYYYYFTVIISRPLLVRQEDQYS